MYAQLYVHDHAEALNIYLNQNQQTNSLIMTELLAMLHETHPDVPLYKQAFMIMRSKPQEEQQNVEVHCHLKDGTDGR